MIDQISLIEREAASDAAELGEVEGRYPECRSDHHGACYGCLWACEACSKTICCQEGTDNDPDLCDACWCAKNRA